MFTKQSFATSIVFLAIVLFASIATVTAQTSKVPTAPATEFTYQGKLNNGAIAANGTYDFKFDIYDAETSGGIVQTITVTGVTVANGIFTVKLGVNPATFGGDERFLEIWATNTGTFTSPMTPRQKVTSSPYAVRAKDSDSAGNAVNAGNANSLGGVSASNYVQTNDARLTDTRTPTAGSGDYIQNGTAVQTGDFSVSGTGSTGGSMSAMDYKINGETILSNPGGQTNTRIGLSPSSYGFGTSNSFNTFVGLYTGEFGTSNPGNGNSMVGAFAGNSNIGSKNNFFGVNSGSGNRGSDNSFFGSSSGAYLSTPNQTTTTTSNNSFFGNESGYENTGAGNSFFGFQAGKSIQSGNNVTLIGAYASTFPSYTAFQNATAIGSQAKVTSSNTIQLGRNTLDAVRIGKLDSAGATSVCLNTSNALATCSSSIRYKQNIQDFRSGLDLIKRLRPVTFNWKADNQADMGLVAEEVNAVEPLLTTTNKDGQVEGVKYDRVGVVLVNAVNEQQTQIEAQQKEIERLKTELDSLKKLVCAVNQNADVCKPKEQK
jgi:hypothetical protein